MIWIDLILIYIVLWEATLQEEKWEREEARRQYIELMKNEPQKIL